MLSLQEGLEDAVFMRAILEEIKGLQKKSVPIDAHVDDKNIVEAMYSTKSVDDKRLRIDISAMKESGASGDVYCMKWCPGSVQLSNCMTKRGVQKSRLLLKVIQSGWNLD